MLKNCPSLVEGFLSDSWKSIVDWSKDNKPNLTFFSEVINPTTNVPVSNCNNKYFNSQSCQEMSLESYIEYWERSSSENEACLYLKDWHFIRDCDPSYVPYRTPPYFSSDWLNEWWQHRTDEHEPNDYKFVYVGPKGSWTPFHSDVFGSYSWSTNVVGKKKWTFFPPGEENKLRDKCGNLVYDIESDEAGELAEKNGQPVKYVIMQETGQTIFVPSGWYHQVVNVEDTISINHNWFNGCNVGQIYQNLKEELGKVQEEISDCKGESWAEMCQDLLLASHGINYKHFLSLLQTILLRRLQMLEDPEFEVSFDGNMLGDNHAKFDIVNIQAVLQNMKTDFQNLELCDESLLCESLLNKIKNCPML